MAKKGDFKKGNKAAEKWTETEAIKFITDCEEWLLEKEENLLFEDFMFLQKNKYRGKIHPNLIRYLSKKYPAFCERLENVKKIQEVKLKKCGLFDMINQRITMFMLNTHHGYVEKKEIDNKQQIDIVNFKETKTYLTNDSEQETD